MKAEEKKEGVEVEVEVEVGIEMKAMEALGKGFDLTSDFRLKFAKGTQRLVVVDEFNNRDILIPAGPPFLLFLSIFVVIKGIDFASSPMFFNSIRCLSCLIRNLQYKGKFPQAILMLFLS